MRKNGLLPAPKVPREPVAKNEWEKEHRAFLRLRPSLLRTYANQYVAVYRGKVVDSDRNKVSLGLRIYAKFGYVPIYVGLVWAKAPAVVRIRSPRRHPPVSIQ